MSLPTGDPASVSALGGALLTQSARLGRPRHRSRRVGAPAPGARSLDDPTGARAAALERAATELDRVGALLQAWTTTAVDAAARARQLAPDLARADLVVEGQLVVESRGRAASTPRPGPASGSGCRSCSTG